MSIKQSSIVKFLEAALLMSGVAVVPSPLAAQSAPGETTPVVFHACYVPGTGTVYRIREAGIRQSCASAGHVAFSWTDASAGGERRPTYGVTDHGALTGLADDDHPHYMRADGARAFTGDVSLGGFRITDLAAGTQPGDALRFEQALKNGDVASGDLAGSLPGPTVAKLRGRAVAETAPADGQVLGWNDAAQRWEPTTPASGGTGSTTDHGALIGLADDDHPQYVLADGSRPVFGLTVIGSATIRDQVAIGSGASTAGGGALAVGANAQATFAGSIALGGSSNASGRRSVAFAEADATDDHAFAAGQNAAATAQHAFAFGNLAKATGVFSYALGTQATASGAASVAIGDGANTNGKNGSITMTAGSGANLATQDKQFSVLAKGGFRMLVGNDAVVVGCTMAPGSGTWSCTSDRNAKTGFKNLDGAALLAKIDAMPIQSWSYKTETGVRHIGPTAQDFHAAFEVGASDTDIALVDAAGVSLAGVQQLSRDVRALREENTQLRAKLASIEERIAQLEDNH